MEHMEYGEVVKRVVGVLTRAQEWVRDPDAAEADESGIIGQLLTECLPPIRFERSWSDEQISAALNQQLNLPIQRIAGAFASAFLQLAEYHDSGQTDVSSADVLRELALRAEGGVTDDEDPE